MPSQHPLSDLPDPAHQSLSQLLSQLRRTTLSVHNRLASIRDDAAFVSRVAAAFAGRPLVANERCGSWYVRSGDKAAGAYFKSTDGHESAWKFSCRRLNLHVVRMVEEHDGVIIVDSTRRGKRMPDALSTTIPIWCTVLNLTLLPEHPLSTNLFLPPYLPATTHAQITALIPSFVASLQALNLAATTSLPTCLTKPLRPFWITRDSSFGGGDPVATVFDDYRPVVCCTASRRVVGSEVDEGGYVQGAGDDTENWACGLTPPVFWDHADVLLDAPEAELPGLIASFVEQHRAARKDDGMRKQVTPHIYVASLPLVLDTVTSSGCRIVLVQEPSQKEAWVKSPTHMEAGLGKNKAASRNLRLALHEICTFASRHLASAASAGNSDGRIIVACDSGKDLSIGAALAMSCYLFDDQSQFRIPDKDTTFTKPMVKARLGSIMAAYPEANPSRTTLQSVNSFLMDWRK